MLRWMFGLLAIYYEELRVDCDPPLGFLMKQYSGKNDVNGDA